MQKIINGRRAQVWFIDFMIGLLIFSFAVVLYFEYHPLVAQEEDTTLDNLLTDAKSVSTYLMSEGRPADWDNSSVEIIGFLNSDNEIDAEKVLLFQNLSYARQKELLRTTNDFYVLFYDENGSIMVINGKCGVGELFLYKDEPVKLAYAYRDSSGHEMEDEMIEVGAEMNITVDVFEVKNEDFGDFVDSNMSNYSIILLEDIEMTEENEEKLDGFVNDNKRFIFMGGQLVSASGGGTNEILGVNITSRSGCGSFPNITMLDRDPMLSFGIGDIITPTECHYANASSISVLGRYYKKNPGAKLEQPAIARWSHGQSDIYYFSHFKAKYLGSSDQYQNKIKDLIMQYLDYCVVQIDFDALEAENVVKVNRFVRYNNQLVKMVVYEWE